MAQATSSMDTLEKKNTCLFLPVSSKHFDIFLFVVAVKACFSVYVNPEYKHKEPYFDSYTRATI